MVSPEFVHLHVHSHHSLLDGLATVPEIVQTTVRNGQPGVALTDHGSCNGHHELWKECNAAGIKPILGCELYYAPEGRQLRESLNWYELEGKAAPGRYTHLTAWALGVEGLRNLYAMVRESHLSGMYYKPRVDAALLGEFAGGIAVSTGCMGGEIPTHVRAGNVGKAREAAIHLRDIFGERLYVECMSHGLPGEAELNDELRQLANDLGLPAIYTGDAHYAQATDEEAHKAFLCLQSRSTLESPKFSFSGHSYSLLGFPEMLREAPLLRPALLQTMDLYHSVDGDYGGVFLRKDCSPIWSPGNDFLAQDEQQAPSLGDRISGVQALDAQVPATIEDQSWQEMLARTAHAEITDREILDRLDYELSVIRQCGFLDYFLVLADIISFCKENGIRVGPGRGSVGGSLTAYRLGITNIDPLTHGLLFERFLNPERPSPPDIDVDVQDDRRDEVLSWITEKYGARRVATVTAHHTIGAKAALHDSARVLGLPRSVSNSLVSLLPPLVRGRAPSLSELDANTLSEEGERVLGVAKGLEGRIRSSSQHAAAVIISRDEITQRVPVYKSGDRMVSGFDGKTLDTMGYTKFDLLGLSTLRTIDECMRLVQARSGDNARAALRQLPSDYSDDRTYDLLSGGWTLGCFQVEGQGMQRLLREVQPGDLGDIAAVLALYRPGPMDSGSHTEYALRKRGARPVVYPHPEFAGSLSTVLDPTYGLIVFQEQVMEILNQVCGWGYAEAGVVFNALRKKDREALARSEPAFKQAGEGNGYSREALDQLWDTLIPFADYSFNKSHAIGYALLTYQTAYLKATYPSEYMAALLSTESDTEKQDQYVREANRLGVETLPPDINDSSAGWTVTGSGGLRRGLASIRGIGGANIRDIVQGRPFVDLDDFLRRCNRRLLRVPTLSALLDNDAFASLGVPAGMYKDGSTDRLVEGAIAFRENPNSSLFGGLSLVYKPSARSTTGGSTLSAGTLTAPLTPVEWTFVLTVCRRYPGMDRLTVEFKGRTLRIPANVSQVPAELAMITKIQR